MDAGLDTGSMLSKVTVTINDTTTAGDLHQVISELGAELIFSAMKLIIKGQAIETPQSSSGITYAKKIQKPELQLEFTMHARDVLRRIHGFSPTPGAFIYFQGTRIKILAAELIDAPISKNVVPGTVLDEHFTVACKQGAVRFLKVQRNGKKIMDVKSFLCGVSVPTGTLFT
jgi:methionyl-tRNA formyltransferase